MRELRGGRLSEGKNKEQEQSARASSRGQSQRLHERSSQKSHQRLLQGSFRKSHQRSLQGSSRKSHQSSCQKRKRRRELAAGLCFFVPDFLGVLVFALVPFVQVVVRSFQNAVGSGWVGLENYRRVLSNAAFRMAARNTLRFTVICIPALIVLSLALAVTVQRMKLLKNVLKSSFLIPVAVPAASVVLVWKVLFHSNGLINRIIVEFGGAPVGWMTTSSSFWVLVLSYLWKNLGYDMVLWLAGLAGIPTEIYEAARVDGAGEWKCFTKITMPNLRPSLYTISVLSFLNSFKVFREAWLVAGDYPQQDMYLLQHLYNNWFRELSFDKISAAAVLTALVVFGMILLLGRAWNSEV